MKSSLLIAIGFLFATIGTARAEEFIGARPLGMGSAYRAIVSSNDAIMLNPAGMSLFRRYAFEAQYLLTPKSGAEEGPYEHVMHASVVDNQIQAFATGLAFTRVERGDDKNGNRYDLAFSATLSDSLFIGTNIKYLDFDFPDRADLEAVTVDVGILLRTDFGLNLAVVGYNLTNPADYIEHPVSMASALMYSPFPSLELSFDWYITYQKPKDFTDALGDKTTAYSFAFGVEYLLLSQITMRAGYLLDQTLAEDDQFWSVGIGYVTQRYALDFGYRGSIEHPDWGNNFGFGLRMFM